MTKPTYFTRSGSKMRNVFRQRLIDFLANPENDAFTLQDIAKEIGAHPCTVSNYLTPETWDEIRRVRQMALSQSLAKVDRAVFAKAANGDISAAKLIYSRWDEINKSEQETQLNWDELEHELAAIQQQIAQLVRERTPLAPPGGDSAETHAEPSAAYHPLCRRPARLQSAAAAPDRQ